MSDFFKITDPIYAPSAVKSEDEMDRLRKVLVLYSCHKFIKNENQGILKGKLLHLLAMYLKYGYDKSTKEKAAKVLGVTLGAVNSYNLDLRKLGYLYTDKYNKHISHLHNDLHKLYKYVNDNNDKALFLLIKLENV
jgi:hypothetical protein